MVVAGNLVGHQSWWVINNAINNKYVYESMNRRDQCVLLHIYALLSLLYRVELDDDVFVLPREKN